VTWFLAVNRFARDTPWLHAPMRLFAEYGVVLFAVLLLASWWLARREDTRAMTAALWAPVGALLALGLAQPVSHHFAARRPYTVDPHVLVLVARSTDFTFPSDHATMAGAVAVGLVLTHRRVRPIVVTAVVAALLMAFARVYAGAHFPRDVIVGLAFGGVVTTVGYLVVRRALEPLTSRLIRTPLRPLLTTQ
jgi:membrane-associated phospholipid phosphatase